MDNVDIIIYLFDRYNLYIFETLMIYKYRSNVHYKVTHFIFVRMWYNIIFLVGFSHKDSHIKSNILYPYSLESNIFINDSCNHVCIFCDL